MFLPSETLGLRRTRFSRALSLLIPAFALRNAPGALPGRPSPRPNAPLPRRGMRTEYGVLRCAGCPPQSAALRTPSSLVLHGFGARLEPRSIVGAGTLDQ